MVSEERPSSGYLTESGDDYWDNRHLSWWEREPPPDGVAYRRRALSPYDAWLSDDAPEDDPWTL